MADKYTLELLQVNTYELSCRGKYIDTITCTPLTALLIDNALNQTSRAGSKTSQAKRDASKRNIAKRWNKNEKYAPHIDAPLDKE